MLMIGIGKKEALIKQWYLSCKEWLGNDFKSFLQDAGIVKKAIFRHQYQKLNANFLGQGFCTFNDQYMNLENPIIDKQLWNDRWKNNYNEARKDIAGIYIATAYTGNQFLIISSFYTSPPLYVVSLHNNHYITTDSRILLLIPNFELEVDAQRLQQWLSFQNNISESFHDTCLKNVRLLGSGTCISFHLKKQILDIEHKTYSNYSNYPNDLTKLSFKEACESFEDLMKNVVTTQDSSKKLIEISGGLDSATVASAIYANKKQSNYALSMYFSDPVFHNTNDLGLAKQCADQTACQFYPIECSKLLHIHGLSSNDAWRRIDTPATTSLPFWQEIIENLAVQLGCHSIWSGEGDYVTEGSQYCLDDLMQQKGFASISKVIQKLGNSSFKSFYLSLLIYLGNKLTFIPNAFMYEHNVSGKVNLSSFFKILLNQSKWIKEPTLTHRQRHLFLEEYPSYFHDAFSSMIPYKTPLLDARIIEFFDSIAQHFLYDIAYHEDISFYEEYAREKQIQRHSFSNIMPESIRTKKFKTSYGEMMVHMIRNDSQKLLDIFTNNPSASMLYQFNMVEPKEFLKLLYSELSSSRIKGYPASLRTGYLHNQLIAESWLRFIKNDKATKLKLSHPNYTSPKVKETLKDV